MSNLLRKPKQEGQQETKARYEHLNLKENPFPNTPFVNKNNADNRYNGRIYESRVREKEHKQVIENFIKVPQSDQNHIRLGYLLDYSFVGRGNGKSAFALNLIEEIDEEYCLNISNEMNKCFGLHITPEPSGRTKTFYSFTDLIFDAILEKGIIDFCLASLRLEAIIDVYPEKNMDVFESEEELVKNLNNLNWLRENEIEVGVISRKIYENSFIQKIGSNFPLSKDRGSFYSTLLSTQKSFKKHYYETLKKGKERITFLFNDLVLFFEAAGFNGAYLIIDDFERIPDFQSEKLKQEFALELRTNFFDGILENAKIGFYNLILVLHAGVPRLVEKAWSVSGMNRRSPMNDDSRHTVRFDKLTVEHAVLMLEKYLEEYRLDPAKSTDSLHPFTEDAVKIISEKSELNASTILEKVHSLVEDAATDKIELIDANYVSSKLGKTEEEILTEKDDILSEDTADLFKKSRKSK